MMHCLLTILRTFAMSLEIMLLTAWEVYGKSRNSKIFLTRLIFHLQDKRTGKNRIKAEFENFTANIMDF